MLEYKTDLKNNEDLILTQISQYKIRKVDRESSKYNTNSGEL